MTDILYNYPKSSCQSTACVKQCDPVTFEGQTTITSLGIPSCTDDSSFVCSDSVSFGTIHQPYDKKPEYKYLNGTIAQTGFASDFRRVNCKSQGNCPQVYVSTDPRLIDPRRASMIALDRPPYDSSVPMDQVYTDPTLQNYGAGYTDYSSIKTGHIQYYVDSELDGAYYNPNFPTTTSVKQVVYKDPMDVYKPHYYREPLTGNSHLNVNRKSWNGQLSSISDSQEQRQDIMSRQMAIMNQNRYQARYPSE